MGLDELYYCVEILRSDLERRLIGRLWILDFIILFFVGCDVVNWELLFIYFWCLIYFVRNFDDYCVIIIKWMDCIGLIIEFMDEDKLSWMKFWCGWIFIFGWIFILWMINYFKIILNLFKLKVYEELYWMNF